MIDFEKHKIYIIIAVLVLVVGLYFGHTWHVNMLIDDKFKKISKDRKKKQMRIERQNQYTEQVERQRPNYPRHDQDSYMEPRDDDENVHMPSPMQNHRLSQENVLTRDMVDGSQDRA